MSRPKHEIRWAEWEIPAYIVADQAAWERRWKIYRMKHAAHMPLALIAERLGLSTGRISELYQHAKSDLDRPAPVEWWLSQEHDRAVVALAILFPYPWRRRVNRALERMGGTQRLLDRAYQTGKTLSDRAGVGRRA